MAKPKVIFLLSGLEKKELEDLRQFLCMPLVNTNDTLRGLLDVLIPLYPVFPEEKIEKEAIHAVLFPGQAYKEKRIRSLFSDLATILVKYYSWRALAREVSMGQLLAVQAFRARGLTELSFRYGNSFLDRREGRPDIPLDQQQLIGFQLRDLLYEADDEQEQFLIEAQDHLDQFFMLSKLRLSAIQFSRLGYRSGSGQIQFLEDVLEEEKWGRLPVLGQLYYRLVRLLASGFEDDTFEEIKTLFFQQVSNLSYRDRRVLFQTLLNIALRVSNEKGAAYLRVTWDLYLQGIKTQVAFMENGELSDTTFTNIVINGAAIEEFEKTGQFIQDYESRLSPDIRSNAVALGRAFLRYSQGEYGEVIGLLQGVEYSSVSYAVRGRSLLLRTYFDQASGRPLTFSDQFYSHWEAFYRYVRRNRELSSSRKQAYLNFLSFTKNLAQIASAGRPYSNLAKVQKNIAESGQVIAKDWLLKRLEVIEKS